MSAMSINTAVGRTCCSPMRPANYAGEGQEPTRCVGPDCMAWRWMDNKERYLGYCGLVGRPDDGQANADQISTATIASLREQLRATVGDVDSDIFVEPSA